MPQALDDITVADFTQLMQGPWATEKLGDMGADVIKIEPLNGDFSRGIPVGGQEDSNNPFFLSLNRNKRSIALDLKSDEGHQIALDIIAEADVVVENFRPGVMENLELGYENATEVNEDVIYVSATGYGSTGPYAGRPGQDLLMQSISGMTTITGKRDDPPTPAGTTVVDELSALLITAHTMMALYYRERTGEGQRVEANLMNAAIDSQCQEITATYNMDKEFQRSEEGIATAFLGAPYGIYETADDYIAMVLPVLPESMELLADEIGLEELRQFDTKEKIYDDRDEIKRIIEAYTRQHPTDELLEELLAIDVWAAVVNDYEDLAEDPQVQHNDMLIEVEHPEEGTFTTTGLPVAMSETPPSVRQRPPALGEHTREVLSDLGYEEDEIDSLLDLHVTAAD